MPSAPIRCIWYVFNPSSSGKDVPYNNVCGLTCVEGKKKRNKTDGVWCTAYKVSMYTMLNVYYYICSTLYYSITVV